jgi:uncharacterized protein (DUF305 family)
MRSLGVVGLALALSTAALAQESGGATMPMHGTPPGTDGAPMAPGSMEHGATPGAMEHGAMMREPASADSPATQAFREINARMHHDMEIAYTGDVDVDFVRLMIPHHESAVEMARVLLAHSSDPATRALAESIVAAQEAEIATMRAYLESKAAE